MTTANVICLTCVYYSGNNETNLVERECLAFSKIPDFIWFGGSHDKKIKGQKGNYKYKDK